MHKWSLCCWALDLSPCGVGGLPNNALDSHAAASAHTTRGISIPKLLPVCSECLAHSIHLPNLMKQVGRRGNPAADQATG